LNDLPTILEIKKDSEILDMYNLRALKVRNMAKTSNFFVYFGSKLR